jgi:pilus assembly protein Flp/PilA
MLAKVARHVVTFLKNEEGPTAVEYAVMLALIISVCFVAVAALGSSTNAVFNDTQLKTGVSVQNAAS